MAKGFARKKLLYVLAGVVVVIVLAGAVLALALDRIVKAGIEKVGPMVTGVTMKVDAVHVSLLHGRFAVEGFEMGNPEGFTSPHCISVGRAEVDAKLSSVFGNVMDIPLIEVKKPQLTLEFSGMKTNFGALLDQMKKPEAAAPKKAGKQMRIGVMRITDASVQVAGLPGGKAVTIPLPKIELTDLSAGGQSKSPAEVAASVLTAVEQAALKAAGSVTGQIGQVGSQAGQAAKSGAASVGKGVSEGAGEVTKGVKSLLGK
jgi:uncharacterized protein involved in outer membrane biogenesis